MSKHRLGRDWTKLAHHSDDRRCKQCGIESPSVDVVPGEHHAGDCPLYVRKRPDSRS